MLPFTAQGTQIPGALTLAAPGSPCLRSWSGHLERAGLEGKPDSEPAAAGTKEGRPPARGSCVLEGANLVHLSLVSIRAGFPPFTAQGCYGPAR
jgi:hypothetical protein